MPCPSTAKGRSGRDVVSVAVLQCPARRQLMIRAERHDVLANGGCVGGVEYVLTRVQLTAGADRNRRQLPADLWVIADAPSLPVWASVGSEPVDAVVVARVDLARSVIDGDCAQGGELPARADRANETSVGGELANVLPSSSRRPRRPRRASGRRRTGRPARPGPFLLRSPGAPGRDTPDSTDRTPPAQRRHPRAIHIRQPPRRRSAAHSAF